jgi:hypothetical protein
MLNAARPHSNWCNGHLDILRPAAGVTEPAAAETGERLRRALFRGRRLGGFGLLRDMHDLLTLATSVHACWMALLQAARGARDSDLEKACRACAGETLRQILDAATRRLDTDAPQLGALADLVPGPAFRALLPPAPVAVAVVLALVALMLLIPGPGRRRDHLVAFDRRRGTHQSA